MTRVLAVAALATLAGLGLPSPAVAQTDTTTLHATIKGWAERTWLLIADRGAADGGRLTDRGILIRFHEQIDAEYVLDNVSARFGLTDEYAWWQRSSGVRYWTGSVNHQDLISGFEVKAPVELGRGWTVAARFDKEDTPPINRNFVRIGFRKQWRSGPFIVFGGSLQSFKPEIDLTAGGGFKDPGGEARLTLTWLDAFNDAIYQGLVVYEGFADTAVDYEKQAFALRASVERRVGRHLRVEADGAVKIPSQIRAYRQVAPDSGFRQEEEFAFVGGLLEWAFSPQLSAGAFASWTRAVTDRTPLPQGEPEDDYRLVEETTRLGGYALWQLLPRWRIEAWVARERRPERRTFRSGAGEDVDYEDRSWLGQFAVLYRALSGFRADAAVEMDLRDVIRGDRQVPATESLGQHNTRLRLEVGWNFATSFQLAVGYRIDLDGDDHTDHGSFDGAHGRFVLHW
jgi:hypothetical protein